MSGVLRRLVPKLTFSEEASEKLAARGRTEARQIVRAVDTTALALLHSYRLARKLKDASTKRTSVVLCRLGNFIAVCVINDATSEIFVKQVFHRDDQAKFKFLPFFFGIFRESRPKKYTILAEIASIDAAVRGIVSVYVISGSHVRTTAVKPPPQSSCGFMPALAA